MLSDQKVKKVKKYLDNRNIEFTNIFKALSDPNRCKLFIALAVEPRFTVSSMAKAVDISLPLASQHLKTLLQNQLVKKEKFGSKVYYELNRDNRMVRSILKIIK
jgi:DNA-binding transcriptional ArsR family regulator